LEILTDTDNPADRFGALSPMDKLATPVYAHGTMDNKTLRLTGGSLYQDARWIVARENYQHSDRYITQSVDMTLLAEVDNPRDRTAVSVWAYAMLVGYLPADYAAQVHAGLLVSGPVVRTGEIHGPTFVNGDFGEVGTLGARLHV
jgi:hypothetical protein